MVAVAVAQLTKALFYAVSEHPYTTVAAVGISYAIHQRETITTLVNRALEGCNRKREPVALIDRAVNAAPAADPVVPIPVAPVARPLLPPPAQPRPLPAPQANGVPHGAGAGDPVQEGTVPPTVRRFYYPEDRPRPAPPADPTPAPMPAPLPPPLPPPPHPVAHPPPRLLHLRI